MPLVQIDLTEDEAAVVDMAAKLERRSRKAQVAEAAVRDSARVIDEYREARDAELDKEEAAQ